MQYVAGDFNIQTRQPHNMSGLPDSHCPEKLN